MIQAPSLPLWAAILVGGLTLLGAAITLLGSIGLLRLPSFYDRVHAPTLGTTLGMASIVLASIICFTTLGTRPILHEILIGLFVSITTPVTLMLLARAALYRDRTEGNSGIPRDGGPDPNPDPVPPDPALPDQATKG